MILLKNNLRIFMKVAEKGSIAKTEEALYEITP